MTWASQITIVEWRWLPWRVSLPELPPFQHLLPDNDRNGRFRLRGEVAAAPSLEQAAAATQPEPDDHEPDDQQWWLESVPGLDPGPPGWYQPR
jgi:hypothetical protein